MDEYQAPKTQTDFLWAVAAATEARDPEALDFLEGVVQGWMQDGYHTMAQEMLIDTIREMIYDSDQEWGKAHFNFPS
jgi:hypothetical protein